MAWGVARGQGRNIGWKSQRLCLLIAILENRTSAKIIKLESKKRLLPVILTHGCHSPREQELGVLLKNPGVSTFHSNGKKHQEWA